MYSQFRAQYPTGSLTSELLKAEPDHYIVRALVQVGGTTLATGLSAASTVEEAEDHARLRALVVLGLEPTPVESQAHLMGDQDPARLQPASLSADLQEIAHPALDAGSDWEGSDPNLQMSAPEFEDEAVPQGRSTNGNRRGKPKSTTQKRKTAQPHVADIPTVKSPIDLSEIIAQTDVELKRLGWTSTQGRRHLQQTYNKRSRQHLTDQELLEFLDFCKLKPMQMKRLSNKKC